MPLNNDLIYTVADRNKTEKQKASNPKPKHTSQNGNLIVKTRQMQNQKTGTIPETELIHNPKGKDTKSSTIQNRNTQKM